MAPPDGGRAGAGGRWPGQCCRGPDAAHREGALRICRSLFELLIVLRFFASIIFRLLASSSRATVIGIQSCDLACPRGRQAAARLAALANLNRTVHLPTYNKLIGEEALALRADS